MSRITATPSFLPPVSPEEKRGDNDFRGVEVDQFLQLMIAELQNQDPLNPMDNSELIQQVNQIRQIGSTNQLVDTLQDVQIGQQLATASAMIGKRIEALTDDGKNLSGVVDRVTVEVDNEKETRTLRVKIGDKSVKLENVRTVES